ncbi:restriction endonuclease subunit S [Aeromonas sp. 600584]|uniref:restriction endonuclease subunit S n=1 Tax=unclassified Aeromonas TaxID=257493 RepID=UPI003B9F936D
MKWPMEKLGVVAPAKPIKKPKIADPNSVWLLNLDMVESHTGRVIEKLFCSPNEAGTSTHWFDENYVLYSKLRPYLNKVVVPDGLGLATTELVPMLPDPERLDKKYLAYYLRSEQFVRWVNEQVAGAKMPRVSMKIFWEHEIPLPPLEEQKRIVAILDKADAICQKRQQAISLTDDFLRSVFLDMFGDPITNPKKWGMQSIGKLLQIKHGFAFKSEFFTSKGEYILMTPGNFFESGGYRNRQEKQNYYNGKIPEGYVLNAGDLLIAMTEQTTGLLGSCLVVPDAGKFLHNQRLGLLKFNQDALTPEYLYYLFNNKSVRQAIQVSATGTKVRHTSPNKIEEIISIVPDIETQVRFSEIVQFITEIKNNLEPSESEIKKLFNSLSQKAFSGQL